jgi:hypothetical protein
LLKLPDKTVEDIETGLVALVTNMNIKDDLAALQPLTEENGL